MDGATGFVPAQLAHLQGFEDYSLAAEGRVTMQEKRQYREVVAADHVLLRPGDSLKNRIDRFQMGRIGRD